MAEVEGNEQEAEFIEEQEERPTKEVLIRNSDMSPEEECVIVSVANSAIEEVADIQGIFETQKFSKMAGIIKREVESKFGNSWYVICGKNFGTYVTHEHGTFIHFSFDDLHVCLFRAP
jgi:dynein light chain LC8-type